MSRYYQMYVEVSGHRPERAEEIEQAGSDEWSFDDWSDHGDTLSASAEDHLTCGETEEQFADRLAQAVWKANGAYCRVAVQATYLENLPCDHHVRDEGDYARLMAGGGVEPAETPPPT